MVLDQQDKAMAGQSKKGRRSDDAEMAHGNIDEEVEGLEGMGV